MPTSPILPLPRRLALAAVASLLPLIAFTLVDLLADARPADRIRHMFADPWFTIVVTWHVVSLPSLFALVVCRHRITFAAVLAVMTGAAAWAGYLVATIDDAQAGLAVLVVSYVAFPLGTAVALAQVVAAAGGRRRWWRGHPLGPPADEPVPRAPAPVGVRVAGLAIDTLTAGAVLVVPLTHLSHARLEWVAGAIGIAVTTGYLAGGSCGGPRTLGQVLAGTAVVDHLTGGPIGIVRATIRALVLIVEVLATLLTWGVPVALADLVVARVTGRSLTDLVLGTAVAVPPPPPAPTPPPTQATRAR